ncbi:Hpt domain-containing protein [Zoogloea sp. 1C4]|uniref:Hpt domain-containing protein n=1 Tax=Zoogloea sp. 1C4 TaxID=2570190 RepID=UPI001290C4A8|nr:Hpt domain-containing protein [Zoogloea sp. 1C4]
MSSAHELDLGPLTWVKGEIDLALERALGALAEAGNAPDRPGRIKFAQTHLHQAHGALSIVGLDGLTQFSEQLDRLLGEMASTQVPATPDTIRLATRCIAAIGNYLDELTRGQPDQALRLFSLYGELAHARGQDAPTAGELFFPDLTLRPAFPAAAEGGDDPKRLRALRGRFERGLLKWFRNADDTAGPQEMRESVAGIESLQAVPASRAFWAAATAFFDALGQGALPADAATKRLCGRIDAQMRRVMEGSSIVAERLMRDVLYHVATTSAHSPAIDSIRGTYQLQDLIPDADRPIRDTPIAPILRKLREALSDAREAWDQFSKGGAIGLPRFQDTIAPIIDQARTVGQPEVADLAAALGELARWLRQDPLRLTDALSMDVATAMLLLDTRLDAHARADNREDVQIDAILERLRAHQRGEKLAPMAISEPDAQARQVNRQLAHEILTSLNEVETSLDGFFRSPGNTDILATVRAPLKQVEGALSVMNDDGAVRLVQDAAARIAALPAEAGDNTRAFEEIAHRLSALGVYIEALQHGPADLARILRPDDVPDVADSVEAELAQQKREAAALTAALKDNPDDIGLRTELQLNLESLRQDASLTADLELEKQARQALTMLDAGELFSAPAPIAAAPAAPALSAEATRLLDASEEEIDAELLSIFIEEAIEVRSTIARKIVELRERPRDVEVLTTIRRSFHTLKGSGRMVGLKDFGEAAWSMEQTLNHWLRLELPVNAELHTLIDDAHAAFSAWIDQLNAGAGTHKDVSQLLADAERLRSEAPAEAPARVTPAPAAPATPPSAAGDTEEMDLESTIIVPDASFTETDIGTPMALHHEAPDAPPLIELQFPDLSFVEPEAEPAPAAPAPAPADDFSLDFDLPTDFPAEAPAAETAPPTLIEAPLPLEDLAPEDEPEALPALPDSIQTVEEALADLEESIELPDTFEAVEALPVEAIDAPTIEIPTLDETPTFDLPVTDEPLEPLEPLETVEVEAAGIEAEPETEEAINIEEIDAENVADDDISQDEVRLGDVVLSRPLFDLYLVEARQHVATLRHELARLSVNPSLVPPQSAIRAAHTLSGISGTARFVAPQALAKALELAEQRLSDHDRAPTADQTILLNSAATALEGMLVQLSARSLPQPAPDLVEQLDGILASHLAEVISLRPEAPPALVTTPINPVPAAPRPAEPTAAAPQLRDELDTDLLPIFLDEGNELLDQLDVAVHNWRGNPTDTTNAAGIARLLHTLKGSARMVGAMSLGQSLHDLETRLERVRGQNAAESGILDELETALDQTRQALDTLGNPEAAAPAPEPVQPASPVATHIDLDDTAPAQPGELAAQAARTMLRVEASRIDQFVNEAGEISIARTRIEGELRTLRRSLLDLTENVIRLRNQLREVEIQADTQMQSRLSQVETHHTEFDPLEMDRYTRLQELTRMMAESVGDVTTVQQNLLKNLDGAESALHAQSRMARELQQSLMYVRMVPFDSLAERLYRLVRQTAKELGRRANLDIIGGQIEIDRSVLEAMTGPLGHLVRNAVAHGIEPPDVRRAAGKPEIGQITLRVAHEGNDVVIEFRDDGAGLDFARIRAHALETGLIEAGEETDDKRLTNLIFVPGFTTASLSSLAGRGVGMDVVKSETAAVGGRISVATEAGQGTTFRIHLPLTLAVTQALLVRAGGRTLAIPSSMVAQVLELKPKALEEVRAKRGTEWLGEHFSYRYLPRLLGDNESQPQLDRFNWVLLLRAGSETLALHVDALRGNQEVVVKNAGPQYARMVGYSGATVLGDGEIVLILNPVALAGRAHASAEDVLPATSRSSLTPAQPTVMVVDDSLTVRKITGRLLEREGYRVITAKDGVDALEQLLTASPDVIIADIEMPRMDGFDLTRNIRADARLKAVPIIMITSRTAEKHKRYAEEIGVNHYLGKPYDEDVLLQLIRDFVTNATL